MFKFDWEMTKRMVTGDEMLGDNLFSKYLGLKVLDLQNFSVYPQGFIRGAMNII